MARSGAQSWAWRAAVPDAISAVLGVAGSFFGAFLARFTILFICLFLLTEVGNPKRGRARVTPRGSVGRELPLGALRAGRSPRHDAERFIEEVRSDESELEGYLRIEERELEARAPTS